MKILSCLKVAEATRTERELDSSNYRNLLSSLIDSIRCNSYDGATGEGQEAFVEQSVTRELKSFIDGRFKEHNEPRTDRAEIDSAVAKQLVRSYLFSMGIGCKGFWFSKRIVSQAWYNISYFLSTPEILLIELDTLLAQYPELRSVSDSDDYSMLVSGFLSFLRVELKFQRHSDPMDGMRTLWHVEKFWDPPWSSYRSWLRLMFCDPLEMGDRAKAHLLAMTCSNTDLFRGYAWLFVNCWRDSDFRGEVKNICNRFEIDDSIPIEAMRQHLSIYHPYDEGFD